MHMQKYANICKKYAAQFVPQKYAKICKNMQIICMLYAKHARYAITICICKICKICTPQCPHFADDESQIVEVFCLDHIQQILIRMPRLRWKLFTSLVKLPLLCWSRLAQGEEMCFSSLWCSKAGRKNDVYRLGMASCLGFSCRVPKIASSLLSCSRESFWVNQ